MKHYHLRYMISERENPSDYISLQDVETWSEAEFSKFNDLHQEVGDVYGYTKKINPIINTENIDIELTTRNIHQTYKIPPRIPQINSININNINNTNSINEQLLLSKLSHNTDPLLTIQEKLHILQTAKTTNNIPETAKYFNLPPYKLSQWLKIIEEHGVEGLIPGEVNHMKEEDEKLIIDEFMKGSTVDEIVYMFGFTRGYVMHVRNKNGVTNWAGKMNRRKREKLEIVDFGEKFGVKLCMEKYFIGKEEYKKYSQDVQKLGLRGSRDSDSDINIYNRTKTRKNKYFRRNVNSNTTENTTEYSSTSTLSSCSSVSSSSDTPKDQQTPNDINKESEKTPKPQIISLKAREKLGLINLAKFTSVKEVSDNFSIYEDALSEWYNSDYVRTITLLLNSPIYILLLIIFNR